MYRVEAKVANTYKLTVLGEDVLLHVYDRKHNLCGHVGSKFKAEYQGLQWDPFNYGTAYHTRELHARGVHRPDLFLEAVTRHADSQLTGLDDLKKALDTLEHYQDLTRHIDPDDKGEFRLVQRGVMALQGLIKEAEGRR